VNDADLLPALNRVLLRALLALAEAGHADRACRLAAEAWVVLRRKCPHEAERLNGVMHALTRTIHPAAAGSSGERHGSNARRTHADPDGAPSPDL
jgi:hypothetical protein